MSRVPPVRNQVLSLAGVKELVVVGAPHRQMMYLLLVGCLIVVSDEADHCGVVSKFYDLV